MILPSTAEALHLPTLHATRLMGYVNSPVVPRLVLAPTPVAY